MGTRIDAARCSLDGDDFQHVKIAFPEAPGVRYYLPLHFETVLNFNRSRSLVVHLDHFKNGLRFPLHPFVVKILRGFGMIPSWLTPESIGYLISFLIKAKEVGLKPTRSAFQTVFQLIRKETCYFYFKPCPGYCPVYIPESPKSWKQRFILVSSSDWAEFQPYTFPNFLNPTISHLLTENDKWMLTVCDAGVGMVPRMHEVVTLENLEDFHIATVLHPRGTWAELRALYGENSYLNGHPTPYEISSTGEEDEYEDEEEADMNIQMVVTEMTLIRVLFHML
ncbi:hypothetical protein Dimus_037915 [Dionaea muscipula]